MRKYNFLIICLLFIFSYSLSGCGKTDNYDNLSEEEIDIVEEIKNEYAKQYMKEQSPLANGSWVFLDRYYGEFDGAYVLRLYGRFWGVMDIIYKVDIEEYEFFFNNYEPLVYKDKKFYKIKEAYEQGVLTIDDIKELHNIMYPNKKTDE